MVFRQDNAFCAVQHKAHPVSRLDASSSSLSAGLWSELKR